MNLQWLDHVLGILELVAEEEVDGELGLLDAFRNRNGRTFILRRVVRRLLVLLPLQLPLLLPIFPLVPHRRQPLREGNLELFAAAAIAVAVALFLWLFIVLLDRILEGVFEYLNRRGGMNASIIVARIPRTNCQEHRVPPRTRIIATALLRRANFFCCFVVSKYSYVVAKEDPNWSSARA